MSELPLRAACIHGRYEDCGKPDRVMSQTKSGCWFDASSPCPGGVDVVIDARELASEIAAIVMYPTWQRRELVEAIKEALGREGGPVL